MIIDKVNDILNSHSSNTTLIELCSYIKKNIHRIPQLTIDDISKESLISKGQVSKCIRRLDYENYEEFKNACIEYLDLITKRKSYRGLASVLSFFGSYASILSMVYVVLLYAAPYVIERGGSVGGSIEFIFAALVCIGAIVVLQFINYYFEKAVLECFLGILFFLAVCIILRYSAGSLEKIEQIYSLSDAKLFRFLIGFMLT